MDTETVLPIELWEKIVGNLPPAPPKLVCGMIFTGHIGPGRGIADDFKVSVSKAISIDERELLDVANPGHIKYSRLDDFSWKDCRTHWQRRIPCWSMIKEMCIRAQFLGYKFASTADREKTETCPKDLNYNMTICMFK